MDYKEEYEAMVQRARELHEAGNFLTKKQMEIVCPQLAESEDERIRKVIHKILLGLRKEIFTTQDEVVTKDKALAYLEKQKEQKHPDGCFTCDEYKKGYEAGRLNGLTAGYNKAKKEQKPAEWSEEDELMILTIIQTLETLGGRGTTGMQIDWLKSLSPSWKPSEEQMYILKAVKDFVWKGSEYWGEGLGSLIDDLEKL